jgi:hypothetical protein
VLGTGGTLARLWPLVSQEALPRWFRPFAEIEREATSIRTWEPLIVPGLLQTEDYARALITSWQPGDAAETVEQQAGAHPGLEGPLVLVARTGESDAAYLEVQGRGHVVDRADEVAHHGLLYDILRAVALPPDASREMIADCAKEAAP